MSKKSDDEGWGRVAARRYLARQGVQHGEVLSSLGITGEQLLQYEELVAETLAQRKVPVENAMSKYFKPIPKVESKRQKELKARINIMKQRLVDEENHKVELEKVCRELRNEVSGDMKRYNEESRKIIGQIGRFGAGERNITQLTDQHSSQLKTEYLRTKEQCDGELDSLQRKIDRTNAEIESLKDDMTQLQNYTTAGFTLDCLKQDALEQELCAVKSRNAAQQHDLELVCQIKIDQMRRESQTRQQTILQDSLRQSAKGLPVQHGMLKNDNDKMTKEIEIQRAKCSMLEDEIVEIGGKIDQLLLEKRHARSVNQPKFTLLPRLTLERKCQPDEELVFDFPKHQILPF